MDRKTAQAKRIQMLSEGLCVIPDILSEDFLQELRRETDCLNATLEHHPDAKYQGTHINVSFEDNEIMRRLAEWQPAQQALEELGFGDFSADGKVLILTKEPYGPALYWHQDWSMWDNPLSCSPWPQKIFASYYLEKTRVENGCLKIIPGTHLKRIPLHDQMVPAHEQGARFIAEEHSLMFSDHPDQVDVCSNPGDMVLADARVLHAAYKNQTAERRNMLLVWHSRPATVPQHWEDQVPAVIAECDLEATWSSNHKRNRIPGKYLGMGHSA